MSLGSKSSDNTRKDPKKMRRGFAATVHRIINFVFKILRELAKVIWLLIENAARLTVFCFKLMIDLLSAPYTPCIVAILCFGFVCTIAAAQWFQIGSWLGRLLGVSGMWGIGAGTAGVLLGTGLNVYQLAPQLWKLRRSIAEAYAALDINPDHQIESKEDVKERLQHWLSMDHATLKGIRLATYAIEFGLVVSFLFLGAGLEFFAIITAAISLFLPEKTLELVSATVTLLGSVSDKIHEPQEDHASF